MSYRLPAPFTCAALVALTLGSITPAMARGPEAAGDGGGQQFIERFDEIDVNKDGRITVEEVTIFRQAMVAGTDTNADGKLSLDELSAQEMLRMTERAQARAARMIERLDVDGDGLLSAAELAARPMPAKLFERMDTDGDGAVSKEEADAARAMMAENRGKHRGGLMHDRDLNAQE